MAREVFTPDLLASHIQAVSAHITVAPFEGRSKPSETPFSEEKTQESLTSFARDISRQGLNDYMQSFAKKVAYTTRKFSLRSAFHPRTTRYIEKPGMGEFFFDGDFGLALGVNSYVEPKNTTWIGVTSFSLGNDIKDYFPYEDNPLKSSMPFRYPHPVIVQVQGPSPSTYGYERRLDLYCEAMSVLENYKWERALIGLILDWAREDGIQSVYMLPAEKNRWLNHGELNERLGIRYNGSAKKLGFKLQPNGLYATSVV